MSHRISPPSRRVAAWLAMLAACVAVAAFAALLVRDLPALVLALVAVAVAGASAWFAVTRRGVPRALAAALCVGALVGGVIALALLDAVDELVVLAAALVVLAAAGSRALAPRSDAGPAAVPEAVPRSRRTSGPRAVLLMNPKSGGGKVMTFDLEGEARRRGIEPVLLSRSDDLQELAREAAEHADVIGMAGGDGSQALVAQVAVERDVNFVCIPAGTRNHFALDLGVDRDDVVGALDAFTSPLERRIDVAFVNDRIFVNNVSLGIYAEIVQSEGYRDAKLATVDRMLPELLGPDSTPFDLRFIGPEGRERQSAHLILVSNNAYILDRLSDMGSRPRLDAGELGIVAVEIGNAAQAGELLSLDVLGQARRFKGWLEWSTATFEVASGAPVAAGIDGEAVVLDPPLRFEIAPAALTVQLPPSAAARTASVPAPVLGRAALRKVWDVGARGG